MSGSMEREAIIDRIRALFERTTENGCTEAEAIAAALAAQRLVARYGITDSELSGRREDEDIIEVETASVCTAWSAALASTIATAFRCRVTVTRSGRRSKGKLYTFFGYETDATAAKMAFERLHEVGSRLAVEEVRRWRRKYPGCSLRGVKSSYCTGFVVGVSDELEQQTKALMVVVPEEVDIAYEAATRGSGTYAAKGHITHRSAFDQGRSDGRDASRARSAEGQLGIGD